ncbi:proline and serine-rich protein 2 isoform X2 [Pseudorasbora parva]|uniref:proline and serine-rich protein 2 isoform X2 n=1 Tax=Pseudorasbora parva TaxID=51549 RepID=UPI00351F2176
MDVHMHNNRTLHYGLNDEPRRFSEDDLQFLSLEEQECILFFEETIGLLEKDDERKVERPASHTQTARNHSAVDHDIIDLVHPTPHPNKQKDTLPIRPDFQELKAAPENHYEVKAKRDPPAIHHVSDVPPQEVGHQPPAASAIIANKFAEHEGVTSTSHYGSLELPQNPSVKHGPPTHTKPTRLPNSIGVLLGSRDNIPHSIAAEAASVQERREHKLANLNGSEHPLIGGEPSCVRKLPTRSISFRDPTPDISRMEALSKLGLDQRRSQPIMHISPKETSTFKSTIPANASTEVRFMESTDQYQTRRSQSVMHTSPRETTTFKSTIPANASTEVRSTDNCQTRRSQSIMHTSPRDAERTTTTTFKSTIPANASTEVHFMDTTDHCQTKSSPAPILTSAEVTHTDFNSYGGKSITLNPSMSFRTEQVSTSLPKTEAPEVHVNNFGGRSRFISTSEPNPGVRSKTFFPGNSARTANEDLPKRKSSQSEAPASRSNAQPPTPAPKPQRHPTPTGSNSSEIRHKPLPKQSFRAQGITVQFSGKGATDEARRDALRKLGLLKDSKKTFTY